MIKEFSMRHAVTTGLLMLSGLLMAEEPVPAVDPSCKPFDPTLAKVADLKTSRFDTNLFEKLEGKTIRHIEFNSMPIFDENDPDENNAIYRFVNKLHINTRPKVIASQLLFKEGDVLDAQHVQESARILRTRKYLTGAYIRPTTICDTQVDLLVVTQDSWSLEPQFSVSKKSEGTESGFAITDDNILGTGNAFLIGYEENSQRNLIRYQFSNPHIFHSQIATKLAYADTSDGENIIVDISHPFYALDTPWSAGIYLEDFTQDDEIRHQDEQINSFEHQIIRNEIYYGFASHVSDYATHRWLFGIAQEEDTFLENEETLQPIPENRTAQYPWVEYQYLQNRFGIFKNVNQIQRPEDIALGHNFRIRLGYGTESFDNEEDVFRYIAKYTYTIDQWDKHIFELGFNANGRHYKEPPFPDSSIFGVTGAYHYFSSVKSRWYLGFQYHQGKELSQYEELTLGDITGMRGYPGDFQRGDERYAVSIERRYFSDIHILNLARVGFVVFYDVGKAWGIEEAYGKSKLLSNVGFGLRLSPTKVRIGNVVHVDFAVPTSAKVGADDYQLTIGAFQKF
jgi:outer membrane protein assembly factor BamA